MVQVQPAYEVSGGTAMMCAHHAVDVRDTASAVTPAVVERRHAVFAGVNLGLSHSARQSVSEDAARSGATVCGDAQALLWNWPRMPASGRR